MDVLATCANLQYIHNRDGRFVTMLPLTRWADTQFGQRLVADPDALEWEHLCNVLDDDLVVVDRLRVCAEPALSSDYFRLFWFHRTRKTQRDALSRTRVIERVCQELATSQDRLQDQRDMTAVEVLKAYKRQLLIEKRFSQFKSDFEVAPVHLKEATCIQTMLYIFFFASTVQTLLERELRQALAAAEYDAMRLLPAEVNISMAVFRQNAVHS